jgi:DNA-directed RNA polymerase subunit K/omega
MADKYDEDDDYDPTEEEEQEDDSSVDGPQPIKKNIKTTDGDEVEDEDELDELDQDDLEDEDDLEDDLEELNEDEFIDTKNVIKPAFPNFDEIEEDDDDDDDDDKDDMAYLQKFEENLQKNIIAHWHPELKSYNYDEVDVLSRVVRNEDGVIIDPLHKTLPFITRYETARILGERAKQINAGAKPVIEVDSSVIDGYLIAMEEYKQKKIPFIIQRPLPNGGIEFWKFEDLEIL